MQMTITERLAKIMSRPVADLDRQRAASLFLDWTGCSIAGQKEAAGLKMTKAFSSAAFSDSAGKCTRIGSTPASPLMAVLHNGAIGNVLEMDDVDKRAILHAAPTIMPAALAMAQYTNASPAQMLNAIVIGYEATIRIGRAVGAGHYAYWHNTATCGPFGAAAAACYLLEGSDLVSALGHAGTQAAGLWQTRHEPKSMAKQLHASHAAHAGLMGAILSVQGFEGPRQILEGPQGFFAAMCPGANVEDILTSPDAPWTLHETSIKPYPACRHAHPTIDAALQVNKGADLTDGPILIETYKDALTFCDRAEPTSVIQAKFSLQHSAAITLLKGIPELSDFTEDALLAPEVKALRKKIAVSQTDEFNGAYPAHYGAAITVNGVRYVSADAYGDPEYPMTEQAIIDKAQTLMQHAGMGKEDASTLCNATLALSHADTLATYVEHLPKI